MATTLENVGVDRKESQMQHISQGKTEHRARGGI